MLLMEVNDFCSSYNILAVILFIKKLLGLVFTLLPIALIVVLSIDVTKSVIAFHEEDMKKNMTIFVKRLLMCVALFFVIPIVTLVVSLLDNNSFFSKTAFIECYNNATDSEVAFYKDIENEKKLENDEEYEKNIKAFLDALEQNNKDNNSTGTTNTSSGNSSKYNGTIFVGDTRTVAMCKYLNFNSGTSFKKGDDKLCISDTNRNLNWFKNVAKPQIMKIIDNPVNHYNIVINLGLSDLISKKKDVSDYIKMFNSFASDIGENRLFVVSVTQTNYKKDGKVLVSNSEVEKFNSKLKNGLSSSINYCDVYGYLKQEGYKWSDSKDGINYDKDTYKKIYTKINSCISSAKSTISVGTVGGQKILDAALEFVKKIKKDGDWTYDKSTPSGVDNMLKYHGTTCGRFASYVLYKAGYTKSKNCIVSHANKDGALQPAGTKCLTDDMKVITKKELGRDLKVTDLRPGDVVVKNGSSSHDIAIFAYKSGNSYFYYCANSNTTVLAYRDHARPVARNWFKTNGISAIIRAIR